MKKILIVEDEITIRDELQKLLQNSGYEAVIIKDFNNAEKVVFADLNIGDYVVHQSHGIGQYIGVNTIEADGVGMVICLQTTLLTISLDLLVSSSSRVVQTFN